MPLARQLKDAGLGPARGLSSGSWLVEEKQGWKGTRPEAQWWEVLPALD